MVLPYGPGGFIKADRAVIIEVHRHIFADPSVFIGYLFRPYKIRFVHILEYGIVKCTAPAGRIRAPDCIRIALGFACAPAIGKVTGNPTNSAFQSPVQPIAAIYPLSCAVTSKKGIIPSLDVRRLISRLRRCRHFKGQKSITVTDIG